MKKYIIISLTALFLGCSNVKSLYNNAPSNIQVNNDPTLKKLEATGIDKSIIFFTGGFKNDNIQLTNGSEILFNKSFTTGNNTGLANYEVVNNKSDAKILIRSIDTEFILNSKRLRKYKCIYVSRVGEQVSIEYSNTFKRFM